jgi:long-chain-fatty-acid--CoA ligase ACSBG
MASCIGAGIYSTNTPQACHYISEHSQAEVIVVDGNKQFIKYCSVDKSALPHIKAIVVYNEETIDAALIAKCAFAVYSWAEFLALGKDIPDVLLEGRYKSISPGRCASLIYTSGTTGPPKAVSIIQHS